MNKTLHYTLLIALGLISDSEMTQLVANLNATNRAYKGAGFDEVYLNVIPNKTSILAIDLDRYYHLIERIRQHPNLEMLFIDSYTSLKRGGEKLFDNKGDTHWNCNGKQIWIDEVNNRLKTAILNSNKQL